MSGFKVPTRSGPRVDVDPAQLASFAAGAEAAMQEVVTPAPTPTPASVSASSPALKSKRTAPWIGLDNKRRLPAFNMRFTASEQAKLKFISERCPESMHEFALKAVQGAIRDRLRQLGEEE